MPSLSLGVKGSLNSLFGQGKFSNTKSLSLSGDKSNIPFKILIKNGLVFSNQVLTKVDLGIDYKGQLFFLTSKDNWLIDQVGTEIIIDASDHIVSSGFIDILAENNVPDQAKTLFAFEEYKLQDGVTTALEMHGGCVDFEKYKSNQGSLNHCINYGTSTRLMGIRQKYNFDRERRQAVLSCLKSGALGISHSIEYQPIEYEELLRYAKMAYRFDVPFFLHLRYSSEERELEGVKEAIQLSLDSQAHIHIDHLNSTGGCFNMSAALDMIEDGLRQGARLTTCVYPYPYWATYLHSSRFNKGWQEKFQFTYEDLTIVGTGEKLTKKSFEEYRNQYGLLVASPSTAIPLEKTFDLAIKKNFVWWALMEVSNGELRLTLILVERGVLLERLIGCNFWE